MEPVTLTFNEPSPAESGLAALSNAYMDEIEARTDGKITFERFYGGSLAPATESLSAIGSGLADIGLVVGSIFPGELPLLNAMAKVGSIAAPYPAGYLETQSATLDLFWNNDELRGELEGHGVRPIFIQTPPPADMLCGSEIASVADAQGKTARMGGDLWAREAEAVGFTTTYIVLAELYEALQRGVIDCVAISAGAVVYGPLGLFETAKYYLPATFSSQFGNGYVMNIDAWNALPADVQEIFDEVGVEFAANSTRGMVDLMADAVSEMETAGVEFVDPEPIDAVLRRQQATVVESLRAETGETGVADILDEYESYLAEWEKFFADYSDLPPAEDRSPDAVRAAMEQAPQAVDWQAYREALAKSIGNAR